MITLAEAYRIAKAKYPCPCRLLAAEDAEDCWLFYFHPEDMLGTTITGWRDYAISKKDGKAWLTFFPDVFDKKRTQIPLDNPAFTD